METFKRFMARGDVLLGCGLMATTALLVVGIQLNFIRGDWAAWVQAVGSVIAIVFSVWISHDQWRKQQKVERVRAAQELARVTQFSETVIRIVIDTIDGVRRAQKKWPVNVRFTYHEAAEMKAAGEMLQTVMSHPLPSGVAKATALTWALHAKVDAAALFLVTQANFREGSRFDLFWGERDKEIEKINGLITVALVAANSSPDLNL